MSEELKSNGCGGMNEQIFTPPREAGEILVFTEETGETTRLENLGLVKFRANDYGIFFPVDFYEGDSGEVVILKLVQSDGEGDVFQTLDNEAEAKAVFKAFKVGAAGYYGFGD